MRALSLTLLVSLVACSPGTSDPTLTTRGAGESTPVRAVERLVGHLTDGEFTEAVSLVLEGQAALASLSEGVSPGEVAEALEKGDANVAANFWAGFAQGTGNFLLGPVGYQGAEPVTRDGVTFEVVIVNPPDGGQREILLREEDGGYRVDLFASFGAGLAPRMVQPVERLLGLGAEESRLVLSSLREIVPSLLVASERPGLPAESVQSILQLVEVITRVG
ncbi:MAG: hypothetical protein R3258_06790 [Acidimicrobiia bacterium]|nr:hypothetical protein [Acidimicrobiia bacterium]